MLQFFGHKHRLRIHRDTHWVRFSAGAVNPDRNESGWEPGYNFVLLSVVHENTNRYLDIEAHLLIWQTNPEMFRAKMDTHNEPVYRHRLRLPNCLPPAHHPAAPSVTSSSAPATEGSSSEVAEKEIAMSDRDTRNLVLRFWDLASSQRREIALELGLLEKDEIAQLPEPERYGRALSRAGERGLLERVAEEIEKREEH
jgi:hypothetical protein